jgi:hypothetical protein
MLLIVDLEIIFNTEIVGVYMVHTKFHLAISNGPLFIAVELKRFRAATRFYKGGGVK